MQNLVTVDAMSTTALVLSPADQAAHAAASYVRPAPGVLQLRTQARAAGYNPDDEAALSALACVAGVDAERLSAAFTGRAPLDRVTGNRVARTLNVQPPVPSPRVAAVGVIGRTRGRMVSTVRTPDGITGTVTAAAR